jgi:hypothetical protein
MSGSNLLWLTGPDCEHEWLQQGWGKEKEGFEKSWRARPLAYYSPFLSLSSAREKALKGSISGEIENETIENVR